MKREKNELCQKLASQSETSGNTNGVSSNQQNHQEMTSLQFENVQKTADKFKKENDGTYSYLT